MTHREGLGRHELAQPALDARPKRHYGFAIGFELANDFADAFDQAPECASCGHDAAHHVVLARSADRLGIDLEGAAPCDVDGCSCGDYVSPTDDVDHDIT